MWFNKILSDLGEIPNMISFYEKEYGDAVKELSLKGSLERASAAIPGLVEYRYSQLQDIEGVLQMLEDKLTAAKSKLIRKFMEKYNRELSVRESEKWIDGEEEIIDIKMLINMVAYIRNKFLGIMKGLESKMFQINNIIKLRVASLDDAEVY